MKVVEDETYAVYPALLQFRTRLKVVEDEARKAKNKTEMKTFVESDKSKKTVKSMVSKKGDPPITSNSDGPDSPGVIIG